MTYKIIDNMRIPNVISVLW